MHAGDKKNSIHSIQLTFGVQIKKEIEVENCVRAKFTGLIKWDSAVVIGTQLPIDKASRVPSVRMRLAYWYILGKTSFGRSKLGQILHPVPWIVVSNSNPCLYHSHQYPISNFHLYETNEFKTTRSCLRVAISKSSQLYINLGLSLEISSTIIKWF